MDHKINTDMDDNTTNTANNNISNPSKREPVDVPNKPDEYVMYLFVNMDLKMDKGKMCSQVGHVVGIITEEIIRSGYESASVPETYVSYMKWRQFCKKIVLKASEEQLK